MIAAVRMWLTSIVVVAILLSVFQLLIPEGTIRKIASFTGGLVLIVAMLRPLLGTDLSRLQLDMGDYQEAIEQRQSELETAEDQQMRELIAARTAAYISEEARRLGIAVAVRVETGPGEGGIPVPSAVELSGPRSRALSDWIASELGIPEERQVWQDGNDEN